MLGKDKMLKGATPLKQNQGTNAGNKKKTSPPLLLEKKLGNISEDCILFYETIFAYILCISLSPSGRG
jgi:hypothetical protein